MDYDSFWHPGDTLEVFWRLAQAPDDPQRLRIALGLPPEVVLRCIALGLLAKPSIWKPPELTAKGRERLRGWRTCQDCGEECVETIHHCPRRRGSTPYRSPAV